MFKSLNSKGFTLIELLVVVAIIGLLSSVVLASLNGARIKARNVRRLSDARELVNAFAISLNDNSSLPSTSGVWTCISVTCYDGYASLNSNGTLDTFLAPYIKKAIDPPGGTRGYGGYIYNKTFNGLSGPGAYIVYTLEPGGSCGFGVVWSTNSNYTECMYKVD